MQASLQKIKSTFPVALRLHMYGAQGNTRDANGDSFLYSIGANEQSYDINTEVVSPSPYLWSKFLVKYQDMLGRDPRKDIGFLQDKALVPVDHSIMEFLEDQDVTQMGVTEQNHVTPAGLDENGPQPTTYCELDKEVVEHALSRLEQDVTKHLPIVDMTKFNISVDRNLGEDWSEKTWGLENLSDEQYRDILDKKFYVHGVMRIKFGYP